MFANDFYSPQQQGPYEHFALGDFELERGGVIPNCQLAFATAGTLNAAKDNAILFPHMFSGTSKHMQMYVGQGLALDPERYFVIFPNMLGNGVSSSPHNSPAPIAMADFPSVMIGDDVRAQERLVRERFGITQLELVLGWSMGAQQAYEWAVRFPQKVKRAAPIGGTAQGTPHNYLMVQNAMDLIRSDPAFEGGRYTTPHAVGAGLRLLAHFFAQIGLSKEFYAKEDWREIGFQSLDQFLRDFWEAWFAPMDANALLCLLNKWQHADVARHAGGDLKEALARITAVVWNMPFEQDMMFTVDECHAEHVLTPRGAFRPIPTRWGHFGMLGVANADKAFIDQTLRELLAVQV
ncbi:MAG: alpha/beta fold hydrolase [Gammaproteobacteria bacterium]|nr:alpha/beta fold hydrolase [Gammaproteobacteria bacterium]